MNNPPATADKLAAVLATPQARAILLAAEQRAIDLINRLPTTGASVVPGWKTSEFWCLVVFFLLALTTMLAGLLPPQYAIFAQGFSVGLYQISRGLTKRGN